MQLFQIIKHWFVKKTNSINNNEVILKEMFASAMYEVENAHTLGALMKSRQSIREYQETAIEFNMSEWKDKGKLLDIKWNLKYRLWKSAKH